MRVTISDKYQISYTKWKRYKNEISSYLDDAQLTLENKIDMEFTKHFIQRIVERTKNKSDDIDFIRRMVFHTINHHLCELLYWHHSNDDRDVFIYKDEKCLVFSRGRDGFTLVCRTFFTQDYAVDEKRFFLINL